MASLDDVALLMGELPEVTEGRRYGHPAWTVRGTAFAWLRPYSKADLKRFGDETPPAEPILAVTTKDLHEKEGVLAARIPGVFTIPHFDGYPAVLIQLGAIDVSGLRELVVDAWLSVVPDDLAADYHG